MIQKNKQTRGFVTLATGQQKYYELAYNLLISYRYHCPNPLPFCIIAEEENEYTRCFDKVIIVKNPTHSYMDKIELFNNIPFEQNIFIDADCLAYGDLNDFFKLMPDQGISCIGNHLPLNDTENGWFTYDSVGDYKQRLTYIPNFHGGIMWFLNDSMTHKIYREALDIIPNYSNYKFRLFEKPADEPILALSIAVNGGRLIELDSNEKNDYFVFRPSVYKINCNIRKGKLTAYDKHSIIQNIRLIHWCNYNCGRHEYKNEVISLRRKGRTLSYIERLRMLHNISMDLCRATEIGLKTVIWRIIHLNSYLGDKKI